MDRRRGALVRKRIVILLNSVLGTKCAGIYELKMSISNIGGMRIIILDDDGGRNLIEPTITLYEQRPNILRINSVSACVIDSKSLYLFPDDVDDNKSASLVPSTFDLYNKEHDQILDQYPKYSRKPKPVVMTIGQTVFALANITRTNYSLSIEEECFESFDTQTNLWTGLDCPPFLKKPHALWNVREHSQVTGFALLKEEGYILVSFQQGGNRCSFYSYNLRSNTWKPVEVRKTPTGNDDLIVLYRQPELNGEGVVVRYDNNPCSYIYTYCPFDGLLLVFSCSVVVDDDAKDTNTICDVSLGMALAVHGLEMKEGIEYCGDLHTLLNKSGVVAMVDGLLLCVVHTLFTDSTYNEQRVNVMFVELLRPHKCITLKSFTRTLSIGVELRRPAIKSCFVLDDLEEKSCRRCGA